MEPEHPRERPRSSIPLGRAAFLGTIAAGVGGIALASRFSGVVSRAVEEVAAAIPAVNQIAPSRGWRIYTVADEMPRFDPTTFRLTLSGLVDAPVYLDWSQVDALPAVDQISDFHCVTGWSVNQVHWHGIRPQTIVDLAKPDPSARYVTFFSSEQPYIDQLTIEQFLLPDAMIAKAMDGQPLAREHGAPLRLVIPEMYGYKNVKWVSEIRFDHEKQPGYWEDRGYDVDAWVGKSNGYG